MMKKEVRVKTLLSILFIVIMIAVITAVYITQFAGQDEEKDENIPVYDEDDIIFTYDIGECDQSLSDDWSTYALYNTKPPWRTTHFTSDQLLGIQKQMVKEFYMKPDYMIKRVMRIRSLGELKYWIKAFTGVRKTIFKGKKNRS